MKFQNYLLSVKKKFPNRTLNRKLSLTVLCLSLITLFYHQCSNVKLQPKPSVDFFSSQGFPHKIKPPEADLDKQFHIILVDMTNSMLSGPCPFDVNHPQFNDTKLFRRYDPNRPNKIYSDPNDGRGVARDCWVDPSLPRELGNEKAPPLGLGGYVTANYSTFLGVDPNGDRLEILKKWFDDLGKNASPKELESSYFLIYPISGGYLQSKIMSEYKMKVRFYNAATEEESLQEAIERLKWIHSKNLRLVEDKDDILRWQKTSMGNSSYGEALKVISPVVKKSIEDLAQEGQIHQASFNLYIIGDGRPTPKKEDYFKVLNIFDGCQICKDNIQLCSSRCSKLAEKMKESWGDYEPNSISSLKQSLSLLKILPSYYGGAPLKINFLSLYEDVVKASEKEGFENVFHQLNDLEDSSNQKGRLWKVNSNQPPFLLSKSFQSVQSFEMDTIFLFNLNVRVDENGQSRIDSDGDGLYDDEEISLGRDPLLPRSHSVCLDSIDVDPIYKDHCRSLTENKNCDEQYDADGDSLNECEEIVLGTNPFDFDTDGDSIPDYFEKIYGYNPLVSDENLDSNGDGFVNLIPFSKGIGPNVQISEINENQTLQYRVDLLGVDEIEKDGTIYKVELNQVILDNIFRLPIRTLAYEGGDSNTRYLTPEVFLSSTAKEIQRTEISPHHNFYGGSDLVGFNKITGLVRMRSLSDSHRYFWSLVKFFVPDSGELSQVHLDLSKFQDLMVMDENL